METIANHLIDLFVVRNHEGKYFRAKGQHGYGESWVDDLKKARIYTKIGPARSCVTFWNNLGINKPEDKRLPAPVICRLIVTGVEVLNETERLKKTEKKKMKK